MSLSVPRDSLGRVRPLSCSRERPSERPASGDALWLRVRLLADGLGVGVLCFTGLVLVLQLMANMNSFLMASATLICTAAGREKEGEIRARGVFHSRHLPEMAS